MFRSWLLRSLVFSVVYLVSSSQIFAGIEEFVEFDRENYEEFQLKELEKEDLSIKSESMSLRTTLLIALVPVGTVLAVLSLFTIPHIYKSNCEHGLLCTMIEV